MGNIGQLDVGLWEGGCDALEKLPGPQGSGKVHGESRQQTGLKLALLQVYLQEKLCREGTAAN